MSLQNRIAQRRIKRIGPIGKIVGLLTACYVALIGVTQGLEPQVILWRSLVASIVVGCLVGFCVSVIHVANVSRDSTE